MAFTSGKTVSRRISGLASAAFLSSLAVSTIGCSLGTIQLSGRATPSAVVSGLGGKVMGGEQPIAGATVAIYTVGTSGYGTGAAAITGATTTTDTFGSFNIANFTCPSDASVNPTGAGPLTYIVATGGNPGLGLVATVTGETVTGSTGAYTDTFTAPNNFYVGEAVVFAGFTQFGYLNAAQTITAVTTSATATSPGSNSAFSIADTSASNPGAGTYTDSGMASGKSSTNSAIRLVAPLGPCSTAKNVNLNLDEVATAATAVALAQFISPTTGQIGAPNTVLAQTGIQNAFATVGNLVYASGQAVTSFNQANAANTLTINGAPESTKLNTIADIIASCVNSSGNSGTASNCGVLFANTGAATNPTDTFQAAVDMVLNPIGTPSTNGSQVTALYNLVTPQAPFPALAAAPSDWTVGILYTDTTAATPIIPEAQNIAIDASGNVWILSNGSSNNGALAEITNTGVPVVAVNNGNTVGSSPAVNVVVTANNPRNLAIDPAGNAWFGTTSNGAVWEYNIASGTLQNVPLSLSPYGIAIDGSGNVFFGRSSASATNTYPVSEFVNTNSSGGATLNVNSIANYPQYTGAGTANLVMGQYAGFDPNGNLWFAAGGANTTNVLYQLSAITPCTPTPCNATTTATANVFTGYTGTTYGSPSGTYGVAPAKGGVWFANQTGNNLTLLSTASGNVVTNANGSPFGSTNYDSKPKFLAVDGAGNVWSPNYGSSSSAGVVEFSSTGALLSPYTTSTGTVRGFARTGLAYAAGVGIDPSGNVWIANNSATTNAHTVFEIVGAGAPTITPLAASLGSKIGTKP